MNKELSTRCENALFDASVALLHHKQCIQDIQQKLQHKTDHLKSKCDKDPAQQLLDKTDALFLKYTTRTLLATKKPTKRLKRLHRTVHFRCTFSSFTLISSMKDDRIHFE